MTQYLIVLALLLGMMSTIMYTDMLVVAPSMDPTLVLGFVLLASYVVGMVLNRIKLPKISGYVLAGVIFGPYFLAFVSRTTIEDLSFINSLALAFIAFCAGGEIKSANILRQIRSILYSILCQSFIVLGGVSLSVFFLIKLVPVFSSAHLAARIVISLLVGVVSVASSPSSMIAIISETKAKGDFTGITLSVTIVKDVVVIVLFGVIVSFCKVLVSEQNRIDWPFFIFLIIEILVAFILGFLLGKGITFLLDRVKMEFPVLIIAIGFIVIKFSHMFTAYMKDMYDIAVNLEPLLICMAAGYTVQNHSRLGERFLVKLDQVSLPIYVVFFAIAGATINIDIVKSAWLFGMIIAVVRLVMLFLASLIGGWLSRDNPLHHRNYWLAFITQAGVSLGLLSEIVRHFPHIGLPLQSFLITVITINQIIGPVALKYALNKVGESRLA